MTAKFKEEMKKTPLERKTPMKRSGPIKPKKPRKSLGGCISKESRGEKLGVSELSKLCFAQWAKLVKLNTGYICEWCGKQATDAHHMVGRRQGNALKYAPENGVALCPGCHMRFHNRESHTGWELFKTQRPISYEYVTLHKNDTTKLYVADMRLILADLKEQVARFAQ